MKGNKKSRKIGDIIRIIILLVAFSVLLYPTISNYLYEKNSSKLISEYDDTIDRLSEQDMAEMFQLAKRFNEELMENTPILGDPFIEKGEENFRYESILNTSGTGIMGYIQIPEINVEIPIYHGTSEQVLQVGVGHIPTSSFPIGGKTTHAVLTGHRGLPSKKIITDLDQIKKNSIFYIKILGKTLAYQVDQIQTVLPEETNSLQIIEGQDYVTLVTCTPYGINTHRLLIRGHRITYDEAVNKESDEIDHSIKIPFEVKALLAGLAALLLIWLLFIILSRIRIVRKDKKGRK